jgi:FMN-dependent NADH-azoreductase
MTEPETAIWEQIQSLIHRFQNADRIIMGTSMWKCRVPYKLKQLIDLVAQRKYLFTHDGRQYGPHLQVEKAIVVYTRGSQFIEGTPIPPSRFDHQATYIDFWLKLIGVREVKSVIVDDAWNQDSQQSALSLAKGKQDVKALVDWFW